MSKENHQDRVLKLLQMYGHQSQSYNILRDDKTYFFSPSGIEGVIAYVVNANVALVAGDPVCDPSDFPQFVFEFKQFCKSKKWQCCFQAITDRCNNVLHKMGFGMIKIGEEPFFELDKLSWSGGKFSDLRKDTNSAKRRGLAVIEYFPVIDRRPDWDEQMNALSAVWMKFKGSGEFSFMIGEPSLIDPKERKYFLAILDNEIEAFLVCTPIYARNGIHFDIMRRKEKPLRGTSQLLITETFRLLNEQGYALATLGTAPLAYEHLEYSTQSHMIEMTLNFAFDHLGYFHRYKPLYQFKEQFGPSFWEGSYLAFWPRPFNPIILYALLKAYDPSGVTGKLRRQIQHSWQGVKQIEKMPESLRGRLPGR